MLILLRCGLALSLFQSVDAPNERLRKTDEDADDRDDNEQFDKGETAKFA